MWICFYIQVDRSCTCVHIAYKIVAQGSSKMASICWYALKQHWLNKHISSHRLLAKRFAQNISPENCYVTQLIFMSQADTIYNESSLHFSHNF